MSLSLKDHVFQSTHQKSFGKAIVKRQSEHGSPPEPINPERLETTSYSNLPGALHRASDD